MKKMTAMLLTLALVLSMSLVPAAFAEAEPITIQFWASSRLGSSTSA